MPSDSAGLTLDSTGSSPGVADTGGAGTGGFSSWSKSKKTAAGVGGFLVLAAGAFLYARHKSKGTTSTSSTPVTVTGVSASETGGQLGNGGNLLAGLLGIGTGVTNLANALSTTKAGTESIVNNYTYSTSPNPTPSPSPISSQATLPPVNANAYAKTVPYGSYSPGDYTQIGTVNNGLFTGTNVSGGVPVYANVFGGFQQGFQEATLPQGTGIYIPSSLKAYESGPAVNERF